MYRRVPCDWFLCDGIFRRIRLDSPMPLTEALEDTGVINAGGSFTERLACEWIYRRTWTYSTEFLYEGTGERTFIKLTGLTGPREILLNGSPLEDGATESEFEVTGLLKGRNTVEVRFPPDVTFRTRPEAGFGGVLMLRRTHETAITSMTADANGDIHLCLSAGGAEQLKVKYTLSCEGNRAEREFEVNTGSGNGEFIHNPFGAFTAGARSDIFCAVYNRGKQSDEMTDSLFVPECVSPARGFIVSNEAMTGLSEKAGANCAFSTDNRDTGIRTLAARHRLSCMALDGITPAQAENALQPGDMLNVIAGRPDMLDNAAMWKLTCREPGFIDTLPEDSIDMRITVSRINQALALRRAALDARLAGQPFALDGTDEDMTAPASRAIADSAEHLRPAYYALRGAWKKSTGFTKAGSIPEDGIFSSEVCYVTDGSPDKLAQLKVTAYDMSGKQLNSSSYAVSGRMGSAGRFITELPADGMCIIRTLLDDGNGCSTVYDELVMKPGMDYSALPETQLLLTDDAAVNAGSVAAVYTCVSEAGFFGCLLPGEKVPADRAGEAEGLNIYF